MSALLKAELDLPLVSQGKVRDVFECDGNLLLVATDRVSAFDVVMENGIPGKGEVLTEISKFWFRRLAELVQTQLLDPADEADALARLPEAYRARTTVARRTNPVMIECVARGYICGSLYKEYTEGTASRLGLGLPDGLNDGDRFREPVFSPATKATSGHDENISFDQMVELVGGDLAERLRALTLGIYREAGLHADAAGLILADTKLEFGLRDGELVWIDEALTPDSSRYWEADLWRPGGAQPSFDKQFLRDWLAASGWDKRPPGPRLPENVVLATQAKYMECRDRLLGAVPASG
ncbi:MAG: phosphoribosylaminoimidazolesuccinocarboxamide synthase [Fimbriimonadaceae bacterium]|nr:phosphoribosylaminoimidazolesuccinocarboxamide synthase [Fimbriimonadaceae bacterium]